LAHPSHVSKVVFFHAAKFISPKKRHKAHKISIL